VSNWPYRNRPEAKPVTVSAETVKSAVVIFGRGLVHIEGLTDEAFLRFTWSRYAAPRWKGERERAMWRQFLARTERIWADLLQDAAEADRLPDFDLTHLRANAVAKLGEPCPLCRGEITITNFTVDLKFPISRYRLRGYAGGMERGNPWSHRNCWISCERCARMRGAMAPDEFTALRDVVGRWPDEVQAAFWRTFEK
jgi:5-methylcytosine-specific restriction endonuclease McrA